MKTKFKKTISVLLSVLLAALSLTPFSAFAKTDYIKPQSSNCRMQFVAWADPQVSHYLKSREPYLISSAKDVQKHKKSRVDALVLAGDITENCINKEWNWVYNDIKNTGVKNYITASGNHDIRLHNYKTATKDFTNFTNKLNKRAGSKLRINKLNYSYTIKGYKFIVLGSDKPTFEEADFSKNQLKWLDSELKKSSKKKNHPTFVILHQPLKGTHGLPETWGSPIKSAGSVGYQSDQIKKILNKYPDTILITGHLHTGFGKYTYQKIGNIHSINLPSLGIENKDGTYNADGIGYMVEVYDGKVLFRARDFNKGRYLPKYNISINLYIKNVKLSKTSYKYDGKAKKPSVTVTDVYGKKLSRKYYSISYQKGRRKPGKYKVTVKFKGKYKKAGTITKTFKIKK